MALKVALFAAIALVSVSADSPAPSYGAPAPSYNAPAPTYGAPSPSYNAPAAAQGPAQYDFNYAVKDDYSGNDFGHQESRDGYNTQGSYYVQLPDGRRQKVTYTVNGDSGYVAEVTYEGEAQYPQASGGYQPAPKGGYA
ncbi:pro-resilin-like isoform X1 [Macrobrachium nipponense]|uniref:pro-resilin-like isoform X1 n=1 Tax=Macrobrachium nipponense TaxID=159736 RepID=UPI0030C85626